jgi:phosphoribosylformimino-5-aminoimidazole carboxamide ribotide isomerase
MKIYLAIDIKDGKCVRLKQGKFEESKIFSDDPVRQAKIFEDAGFSELHLVDLDGAMDAVSQNSDTVKSILKETNLSVQMGGGIRSLEQIDFWLNQGVKRVIIGTKAVKDLKFLEDACKTYASKISLAIDAKNGVVATNAWKDLSDVSVSNLIEQVQNFALYSVIYTDILSDGMLNGPNFTAVEEVANSTKHAIIASGGISSIDDLVKLNQIKGIGGAIIGTAIYEGLIKLEDLKNIQ